MPTIWVQALPHCLIKKLAFQILRRGCFHLTLRTYFPVLDVKGASRYVNGPVFKIAWLQYMVIVVMSHICVHVYETTESSRRGKVFWIPEDLASSRRPRCFLVSCFSLFKALEEGPPNQEKQDKPEKQKLGPHQEGPQTRNKKTRKRKTCFVLVSVFISCFLVWGPSFGGPWNFVFFLFLFFLFRQFFEDSGLFNVLSCCFCFHILFVYVCKLGRRLPTASICPHRRLPVYNSGFTKVNG